MTLSVLGAGLGRTGTMSLKAALERLGHGPCYHMVEVFEKPDHDAAWLAATRGQPVGWEALFEGYRAAVDWPAAHFWRELSAFYPRAGVILSLRDASAWYDSVAATIYPAVSSPPEPGGRSTPEHRTMTRELILERTFDDRFEDRGHAIEVFERHNQAVIDAVPAERLLILEVGAGWEPLCEFLDCEVPDEPYPRTNSTAEFQARFRDEVE